MHAPCSRCHAARTLWWCGAGMRVAVLLVCNIALSHASKAGEQYLREHENWVQSVKADIERLPPTATALVLDVSMC